MSPSCLFFWLIAVLLLNWLLRLSQFLHWFRELKSYILLSPQLLFLLYSVTTFMWFVLEFFSVLCRKCPGNVLIFCWGNVMDMWKLQVCWSMYNLSIDTRSWKVKSVFQLVLAEISLALVILKKPFTKMIPFLVEAAPFCIIFAYPTSSTC